MLISLTAAAICAISVAWFDRPLARAIAGLIPPAEFVPDVPDTLAPLVGGVSIAGLITWYVGRVRRRERVARVALLVAAAGPLALGTKYLAKWLFGRTEIRLFLADPRVYGFHWFAGTGNYIGFPSGHMLVAAAWVATVVAIYPGLRAWGRLALAGLALALLLGSYHFLGDLIAGAFLGTAVGWLTLASNACWRRAAAIRKRHANDCAPP